MAMNSRLLRMKKAVSRVSNRGMLVDYEVTTLCITTPNSPNTSYTLLLDELEVRCTICA